MTQWDWRRELDTRRENWTDGKIGGKLAFELETVSKEFKAIFHELFHQKRGTMALELSVKRDELPTSYNKIESQHTLYLVVVSARSDALWFSLDHPRINYQAVKNMQSWYSRCIACKFQPFWSGLNSILDLLWSTLFAILYRVRFWLKPTASTLQLWEISHSYFVRYRPATQDNIIGSITSDWTK